METDIKAASFIQHSSLTHPLHSCRPEAHPVHKRELTCKCLRRSSSLSISRSSSMSTSTSSLFTSSTCCFWNKGKSFQRRLIVSQGLITRADDGPRIISSRRVSSGEAPHLEACNFPHKSPTDKDTTWERGRLSFFFSDTIKWKLYSRVDLGSLNKQ